MNEERRSIDILKQYPEPDLVQLEHDYQEALKRFDKKVIVLDDDPTGVQTVHGISVYTDWSEKTFQDGFEEKNNMFFILTNSRAMTRDASVYEHHLMAERIVRAAKDNNRDFVLISRSDSTLRGHYPTEPETLRHTVEALSDICFDGEIIYPFFLEGGRYTIDNVHYVKEGNTLVPAGQTEFAHDKTFGYHASHLGEWIQEKTGDAIKPEDCIYIELNDLRALKYEKITSQLLQAHDAARIIVNSIDYCDVKAFTIAFIDAVNRGKHFIFRSAAAITKVLGGVPDRPLLTREELVTPGSVPGGIVIIGSHVQKTTRQLEALEAANLPVTFIEFNVSTALTPGGLDIEKARVTAEVEHVLRAGGSVTVYTSRQLLVPDDGDKEKALSLSVAISNALTGIVSDLSVRPAFIVAKGGITSSDVGTKALRVHRATVMGQIKPGIPVWMTGEESKFPHMPYVIFPGNVGEVTTLRDIVAELMR